MHTITGQILNSKGFTFSFINSSNNKGIDKHISNNSSHSNPLEINSNNNIDAQDSIVNCKRNKSNIKLNSNIKNKHTESGEIIDAYRDSANQHHNKSARMQDMNRHTSHSVHENDDSIVNNDTNYQRIPCHQPTPNTHSQSTHEIFHYDSHINQRNSQSVNNDETMSDNNYNNSYLNSLTPNNTQIYDLNSPSNNKYKSTANTNCVENTNKCKCNINVKSDSHKKSGVEFVDLTNDDQFNYSDNESYDQHSITPIHYDSYDDYGFSSRTIRVTQDGQNLKISNNTHLQNSIDSFCDICSEATCDKCKGCEACYNLRVAALLNKYSYGQLYRISRDPNLNDTQRTLIFEAYRNLMREKFLSYSILYEHKATGKIHKINKNFAFILTENERILFIHKNNVLLSSINPKFSFYDALQGKAVMFDIIHDPVADKPAAINLKLLNGALIDSLLPMPPKRGQKAPSFLPYSPPRKQNGEANVRGQNDTMLNQHSSNNIRNPITNRNQLFSLQSMDTPTPKNHERNIQNTCDCDLHPSRSTHKSSSNTQLLPSTNNGSSFTSEIEVVLNSPPKSIYTQHVQMHDTPKPTDKIKRSKNITDVDLDASDSQHSVITTTNTPNPTDPDDVILTDTTDAEEIIDDDSVYSEVIDLGATQITFSPLSSQTLTQEDAATTSDLSPFRDITTLPISEQQFPSVLIPKIQIITADINNKVVTQNQARLTQTPAPNNTFSDST